MPLTNYMQAEGSVKITLRSPKSGYQVAQVAGWTSKIEVAVRGAAPRYMQIVSLRRGCATVGQSGRILRFGAQPSPIITKTSRVEMCGENWMQGQVQKIGWNAARGDKASTERAQSAGRPSRSRCATVCFGMGLPPVSKPVCEQDSY